MLTTGIHSTSSGELLPSQKAIFQKRINDLQEKWKTMQCDDRNFVCIETKRKSHPVFVMESSQASIAKGDIYELCRLVEDWGIAGWSPDWQTGQKNRKLNAVELPRLIEDVQVVQITQALAWSTREFHTKAELLTAMQTRIDKLRISKFRRAAAYIKRMQNVMQQIKYYPAENWRVRCKKPGEEVRARVRLTDSSLLRTTVHSHGLIVCGDSVEVHQPISRDVYKKLAFKREYAAFTCDLYDYFDVEACLSMLRDTKKAADLPLPYRIKMCLL